MSNDRIAKNPETSNEPSNAGLKRRDLLLSGGSLVAASALSSFGLTSPAHAQQRSPASAGQRPNIVFIMGDDIGWFNIGAYHQGIMASRTPNLDKLAELYPKGGDVTVEDLVAKGAVRDGRPVKVLGTGALDVKVNVNAHRFSGSAKEKIEAAGGTTTTL